MDYRKSAQEVIKHIGGKENIMSAAHCATRLRLVIADNSKMDAAAIENVDGVKGVFEASGQIQMYNAIEMIVAAVLPLHQGHLERDLRLFLRRERYMHRLMEHWIYCMTRSMHLV